MPRPIHFEIPTDDPARAQKFYSSVFGWEFTRWDGPQDYWLVRTGSADAPGIDGGLLRRTSEGGGVVATLDVDDVTAFATRIEGHGGRIVVPRMPVPGVGWLAYFADPDGHVFGMMQPDPEAR